MDILTTAMSNSEEVGVVYQSYLRRRENVKG
jgi:hypothetical protein